MNKNEQKNVTINLPMQQLEVVLNALNEVPFPRRVVEPVFQSILSQTQSQLGKPEGDGTKVVEAPFDKK
jgi:hypothetical protein